MLLSCYNLSCSVLFIFQTNGCYTSLASVYTFNSTWNKCKHQRLHVDFGEIKKKWNNSRVPLYAFNIQRATRHESILEQAMLHSNLTLLVNFFCEHFSLFSCLYTSTQTVILTKLVHVISLENTSYNMQ